MITMNRKQSTYLAALALSVVFLLGLPAMTEQPALQESSKAEAETLKSIEGTHIRTFTKQQPFQPGGLLKLSNANGAVKVTTWDKPEVWIRAEKRMRVREKRSGFLWLKSRLPFKTIRETEEHFQKLQVEISGDDKSIIVETKFPKHEQGVNLGVDYQIRVPRQAQLDLKTSNGQVSVAGVSGTVKMRSSNGQLIAEDLQGTLSANTSNGKVRVSRLQGDAEVSTSNGKVICEDISGNLQVHTSNGEVRVIHPGPLSATDQITCRTSNGRIELSLGAGSSFDLDAGTSNGNISTDFPVTVVGKISKQHLSGKVGTGGAKVDLHTSNGSISIRKT